MAKYYLIDDDIVTFDGFDFRVRIWRSREVTAVLVDSCPGSPPPDLYSTKIANMVARTNLGFVATKIAWYERCRFEGQARCFYVSFSRVGHKLRPILIEPTYRAVKWDELAKILLVTDSIGESVQSTNDQES